MIHHPRLLIALSALTVLLTGCLRWPGPTSSPRTLALYGGQEGYELVHVPALARVELYRLAADPAHAPATARRIGGIPVASGPSALDDAALKRVSEILRDEASYDWTESPGPSTHPAQPPVALRFSGAKKTIDLVFSFADNALTVYEGDQRLGHARLTERAAGLPALLAQP